MFWISACWSSPILVFALRTNSGSNLLLKMYDFEVEVVPDDEE